MQYIWNEVFCDQKAENGQQRIILLSWNKEAEVKTFFQTLTFLFSKVCWKFRGLDFQNVKNEQRIRMVS